MGKTNKTKVVSMVLNSVMHDARVLKQAETLSNNGYNVTVIGIKDNKNNFDLKMLNENLAVKLVPWKSFLHGKAANIAFLAMCFCILVTIIASFYAFNFFNSLSFESFEAIKNVTLQGSLSALVSFSLLFVIAFLTYKAVHPFYTKQKKFSVNYGKMENIGSKSNVGLMEKYFERLKQGKIVQAILAESPDILHCHDVHGIVIAKKVKLKSSCKVIFDAHEIYEEVAQGSSIQKKHNHELQLVAENISDGFVTINESIASYYKKRHPKLPDPTIIKNAVKYKELPPYDGRLHEAAGLSLEKNILLYQGGFANKRGLFNLLKVAKFLPENWSLVFMGWGNIKDALLKEMKNERAEYLRKNLKFDGHETAVENKAKLINESIKVISESFSISKVSEDSDREHFVEQSNVDEQNDGVERQVAPQVLHGAKEKFNDKKELIEFNGLLDKQSANDILKKINEHVSSIVQLEKAAYESSEARNLFDKVVFVDKAEQSELPLWTSGAKIGVIPYENVGLNHYYCTPNKLWEYPVAGVPLLVSPFPEMKKVVEGANMGWLLSDPINPKEVANFINSLSEEELSEKASNCLKFIKVDNWDKYAERLLALYKNLLKG